MMIKQFGIGPVKLRGNRHTLLDEPKSAYKQNFAAFGRTHTGEAGLCSNTHASSWRLIQGRHEVVSAGWRRQRSGGYPESVLVGMTQPPHRPWCPSELSRALCYKPERQSSRQASAARCSCSLRIPQRNLPCPVHPLAAAGFVGSLHVRDRISLFTRYAVSTTRGFRRALAMMHLFARFSLHRRLVHWRGSLTSEPKFAPAGTR